MRPAKELALSIASTYSHAYVASCCLEAQPAQTVRAFAEAIAHPGPALIIAYAPCAMMGIEGGMACSQGDAKEAVEAGMVSLWRRQPGKRLAIDSGKKEPKEGWDAALEAHLAHENRFGMLMRKDPELGARLHRALADQAARRRRSLAALQQLTEQELEAAAAREAGGGGDKPAQR
jgi:pyruvate-ferredoxin/flavodoxin oxidoreductase